MDYIVKKQTAHGEIKITIPAKVVKRRGWEDARYMLIQDREGEDLKVRRLEYEEGGGSGRKGNIP